MIGAIDDESQLPIPREVVALQRLSETISKSTVYREVGDLITRAVSVD